jgi:hypothetical protein
VHGMMMNHLAAYPSPHPELLIPASSSSRRRRRLLTFDEEGARWTLNSRLSILLARVRTEHRADFFFCSEDIQLYSARPPVRRPLPREYSSTLSDDELDEADCA